MIVITHREYNKAVSNAKGGVEELDEARSPHTPAINPKAIAPSGHGRTVSSQSSESDDDEGLSPAPAVAPSTVVAATKKPVDKGFFGAGVLPTAAPPANDTFRRRRLTFATQGNIPPHTPLSQIQSRVFRSLEIGDIPKVPLPFAEGLVGTYSCHGIEPSYMDSRPFVAKINQDR